jgi:hypothetical protein
MSVRYDVLHEFAAAQRISYNELCETVHRAVCANAPDSSRRDLFAAAALTAYINGCIAARWPWTPEKIAREAWLTADAMLLEGHNDVR